MRSARDYAADALLRVERGHGWVHEHLAEARKHVQDVRDRALMTELAYGVMRRRGTLDAVIGRVSKRRVRDLHPAVKTALRVATYQLVFFDKVPAHAALDHAAGWAKHHSGSKRAGYVNACLRALIMYAPMRGGEEKRKAHKRGGHNPRRDIPVAHGATIRMQRSVFPPEDHGRVPNWASRFAHPQWLVSRWLKGMGETDCLAQLLAGVCTPSLTLRERPGETPVTTHFESLDIQAEQGTLPGSWHVRRGMGRAMQLVESEVAAVQDESSQQVVPLLAPQAGERVLDLCAAPGGKTLHIADVMRAGEIVACDISDEKLKALSALKMPFPEITCATTLVPAEGDLPWPEAHFDAVLVDAPCSNTGVFRRRVEARWRLRPEDFASLAKIQQSLLERVWRHVKPGGRLVYSTCSVESEENEDVVNAFLESHQDAKRDDGYATLASTEADGGAATRIIKTS